MRERACPSGTEAYGTDRHREVHLSEMRTAPPHGARGVGVYAAPRDGEAMNPARVIRDWLVEAYGADKVDVASFERAIQYCEELVNES